MYFDFYTWKQLLVQRTSTPITPLNAQIDYLGLWRISIFFGLILLIFMLAWKYRSTLGGPVVALWGYALTRAIYYLEFPTFPFGDYNVAFISTAGQNFCEAFAIPLGVILLGVERIWLWSWFRWVIAIEILLVWIGQPGLMTVPRAGSLDLALIAMFVPFLPWWLAAVAAVTIVTHHGATAQSVLAVQTVVYIFAYVRRRQAIFLSSISVLGLTAAAYVHTRGASPFDSYGRITLWTRAMNFWIHGSLTQHDTVSTKWILLGVGPGSFMWTSFLMDNFRGEVFPWLHSEWLQIPWELGVVALVLVSWVLALAVIRAWECPQTLAAVLGCAVCALSYHPLRYFPSALLVALVMHRALYEDKKESLLFRGGFQISRLWRGVISSSTGCIPLLRK